MEYKAKQGMVVYRSKHHATLKRNFQIMPGAAWLKLLLQHVPDRGEHLVRNYSWYSNRSRGDRIRGEWSDGIVYKQLIIDRCVSIADQQRHRSRYGMCHICAPTTFNETILTYFLAQFEMGRRAN